MGAKLYLTTYLKTENSYFANWAANLCLTPIRDLFGGKVFCVIGNATRDVTPLNSKPFWEQKDFMISLLGPGVMGGIATYYFTRQFPKAIIATILTPAATLTGVVIFGIAARIFSLAYEEVRNGFELIDKKPSDPLPPPKPLDPVPPPQQEMSIEKRKTSEKLTSLLQPGQQVGTAIDGGDCFYDAVAQTLQAKGLQVSMDDLRLMIGKAIQEDAWTNHIDQQITEDYLGIGETYEGQYRDYVGFTGDELKRLIDDKKPSNPFWGAPEREGVILCQKYNFTLRVLSVGIHEEKIENDQIYKMRKGLKDQAEEFWEKNGGLEQPAAQTIMAAHAKNLKQRRDQLLASDDLYWTEDTTYGEQNPTVCTIAVYRNHFVPILG